MPVNCCTCLTCIRSSADVTAVELITPDSMPSQSVSYYMLNDDQQAFSGTKGLKGVCCWNLETVPLKNTTTLKKHTHVPVVPKTRKMVSHSIKYVYEKNQINLMCMA